MGLMTFACLIIGLKAPAVAVGQGSDHSLISVVCPAQISMRRFQSHHPFFVGKNVLDFEMSHRKWCKITFIVLAREHCY